MTLGWRLDSGIHAGGHLSCSRLSGIELSPMGSAAVIEAAGGTGISAAAGMRTEFQGMTITPRAGLELSSVKAGGFVELAAVEGAGEVSEVAAKSLKGTLGARIGMAAGETGTIWAAADAEHDFKDKTNITVPGGEFRLSGMMTLSGGTFCARAAATRMSAVL